MLLVRPLEIGYEAYTHRMDLAFADKTHQALFSFLESDLTEFCDAFQSFLDAAMPDESCEVIIPGNNGDLLSRLLACASALHPLLGDDSNLDTLSSSLLGSLNARLIKSNLDISLEEYSDRARMLTASLMFSGLGRGRALSRDAFIEIFYKKYKNRTLDVFSTPASYLSSIQSTARRQIYWMLDASSCRFGNLTIDERCRLYRSIFAKDETQPDLSFRQFFSWGMPKETLNLENVINHPENAVSMFDNKDDQKELSGIFSNLEDDDTGLDAELSSELKKKIQEAKEDASPAPFEEYMVNSLHELVTLEIRLMVTEPCIVKRCRHCGRYFLAEKSNIDYCSRIAPGEELPCDVVGPRKSFNRLLDGDGALKAYNAAYKTYYARLRRGSMSDVEFAAWRDEAKARLEDARKGGITLEEYSSWLKQDVRKWTSS